MNNINTSISQLLVLVWVQTIFYVIDTWSKCGCIKCIIILFFSISTFSLPGLLRPLFCSKALVCGVCPQDLSLGFPVRLTLIAGKVVILRWHLVCYIFFACQLHSCAFTFSLYVCTLAGLVVYEISYSSSDLQEASVSRLYFKPQLGSNSVLQQHRNKVSVHGQFYYYLASDTVSKLGFRGSAGDRGWPAGPWMPFVRERAGR